MNGRTLRRLARIVGSACALFVAAVTLVLIPLSIPRLLPVPVQWVLLLVLLAAWLAIPIAVARYRRLFDGYLPWLALIALLLLANDAAAGYLAAFVGPRPLVLFLAPGALLGLLSAVAVTLARRDRGIQVIALALGLAPWILALLWVLTGGLFDALEAHIRTDEPAYMGTLSLVNGIVPWIVALAALSVSWHSAVLVYRELSGAPPRWSVHPADGGTDVR